MIELFQFDFSPYCIKIRALLNFKDLDYRTVEVLPFLTQYKVRRISGQSQVPVLRDGGAVVIDSTEIALYLESMYPTPATLPSDHVARQRVLLWEDWADQVFSRWIRPIALEAVAKDPAAGADQIPPYGSLALDLLVPKVSPVISRMLIRHYGIVGVAREAGPKLTAAMDLVTAATEGTRYLVGDSMSLADIAVATAARPLDTIRSVRNAPRYAAFFQWRDQILAECFIH
jgi:glutathione S-transferase